MGITGGKRRTAIVNGTGPGARSRLLPGIAVAISLLFGWSVPAADAALQCGDTITADKKLKKDLLNCPGDGIVIGTLGTELDLNGHKITSVGSPDTVGIEAPAPGAVVKGPGSVRSFDTGIHVSSADQSVVKKVDVRRGDNGIRVSESSAVTVRKNRVRDYKATGISLGNQTDLSLIERNEVVGPDDSNFSNTGVTVAGGADNVLRENTLVGGDDSSNGFSVRLSAARTRLILNRVMGFGSAGVLLYEGPAQTLLKRNVFKDNGFGINVSDISPAPPADTKIIKNVASRNTVNGIDLDTDGSVLRDNIANQNGAWGIFSSGSSIDQGGNRASGNGQPGQCSGVDCS